MISGMTIGELASRTGVPVRTLRFYADAGVLAVAGRSESGYRLFSHDAVARARLIRTLRELGVGLADVRRVLQAEVSVAEVAEVHMHALDAQIRTLRLRRAVLSAAVRDPDSEELSLMTDLTVLTAEERRRILDEYLDAVFGAQPSPVAEKMRTGAPDLPDDPSPDQIAAWVELVELLRDPDFVAASRRMAQQVRDEGPAPDPGRFDAATAVAEHAGAAARAGVAPDSAVAREVVERLEAMAPGPTEDRAAAADRIEAFNDRRVGRYWALVAVINGWPALRAQDTGDMHDAWEWYARALRAHADRETESSGG